MRGLLLPLVALTVLAASASAAMSARGATALATPQTAGATPARLKISLSLELRCARPGLAAIVVSLPSAWRVPNTVAPTAVWINSAHPKGVHVSGNTLTLEPAVPRTTCMVLAPGRIKMKFTRAAMLGNPLEAGGYTIHVSIGKRDFRAPVSITPA